MNGLARQVRVALLEVAFGLALEPAGLRHQAPTDDAVGSAFAAA